MNEKLKNTIETIKKNIFQEYNHLVITILLILICILSTFQNIRINKVYTLLKDFQTTAINDCTSKKCDNFQNSNFNSTKKDLVNEKNAFSFFTTERYDKEKKVFVVEVGVPEDIQQDNINIELNNNTLKIAILQTEEVKNGDSAIQNFIGFSRFFIIPQTRATVEDVKYEIKNGVLTAIIPIF